MFGHESLRMTSSKECRLGVMLSMIVSFFIVELLIGHIANSLALVADSFHMLSDSLALVVAVIATRFANRRARTSQNTYGYARAEILGALVNAVFLVALCFTILIHGIQRLIEPEELEDPQLVLLVGMIGLIVNLIGLFMFHNHGHHHHHHHHRNEKLHEDKNDHVTSKGSFINESALVKNEDKKPPSRNRSISEHTPPEDCDGIDISCRRRSSFTFDSGNNEIEWLPTSKQIRPTEMFLHKHLSSSISRRMDAVIALEIDDSTNSDNGYKNFRNGFLGSDSDTESMEQLGLNKTQMSSAHDHAGGMNVYGVFLHLLGDALGSVIVIITSFVYIFAPEGEWRMYVDPSLSIFLVCIILSSTLPLLKDSGRILLQNVPQAYDSDALVADLCRSNSLILDAHDFHLWQLSGQTHVASVHVVMESSTHWPSVGMHIKDFFHKRGIHASTVQAEFLEPPFLVNYKQGSGCLLTCSFPHCVTNSCCQDNDVTITKLQAMVNELTAQKAESIII